MLLSRIVNYLYGTVCIRIRGTFPERLINLCVSRQIYLWDICKQDDVLFARMYLADFFRIRPLVKMSKTQVKVVEYTGLPFVMKKIKRRKMLVIGAVLFLLGLHVLSSYVWFIELKGVKMLSKERILEVAEDHGLKPGVLKKTIDTKQIEDAILFSLPEVAWVEIGFTGTRAEIEIVEKTLPKTEDKTPAHIVAMKDGVITEIITIAGQPAVKKGDTVKKGDLLIRGFATPSKTEPPGEPPTITVPGQLIRAKGLVKARVWYEGYGEAGLMRELRTRTGRRDMAVDLLVGPYRINVKRVAANPFPLYCTETIHKKMPWRNSGLTVESIITVYHELTRNWQQISLEEARDEAKTKALQAVERLIPETATILTRNIEVLQTAEPDLVRVKISVETIEEIGQSLNITQE